MKLHCRENLNFILNLCYSSRVEADYSTSTKRKPCTWGYNWTTPSLDDINAGTSSFGVGVGRKADEPVL
jgi:hypothetical protein